MNLGYGDIDAIRELKHRIAELEAENINLRDTNAKLLDTLMYVEKQRDRLADALHAIIKHQLTISPTMAPYTSVMMIAKKALDSLDHPNEQDNPAAKRKD